MDPRYKEIAQAIRFEVNPVTGQVFLVFEITDPETKKKLQKDWTQDLEFEMLGKKLVYKIKDL